jgi:hypothetical protein
MRTTLKGAVKEVIKAIEGGERMPDRLGRKVYRQEFGEAFLDMLRAALADSEANTCAPEGRP